MNMMRVLMNHSEFQKYPKCPKEVPMDILNEEWAHKNHLQTLSRLNERGGLHPFEMYFIIEKKYYKKGLEMNFAIDYLCEKIKEFENGNV